MEAALPVAAPALGLLLTVGDRVSRAVDRAASDMALAAMPDTVGAPRRRIGVRRSEAARPARVREER
jgi:hypothetical protein